MSDMEKAFLSVKHADQLTEEMNQFLEASAILANELAERIEEPLTEAERQFLGHFKIFNDEFEKLRKTEQRKC
ncbi:hypothetical protein [Effusibacillus consociatus]|uniref:Uncharacterized protein n=1 Tax=Effusibacillus consociatus TaxID=1117041 RepID=A0ABV9Q6P8_9BACL